MQRAGVSSARLATKLISEAGLTAPVLVLAGPGNNGGDALETADHLAKAGVEVFIALFTDGAHQPQDAQRALTKAKNSSARFLATDTDSLSNPKGWSLVIDGLFGIGLTRPLSGNMQRVVENVNKLTCPVLALDVPSGLDADTGNIVGETGLAVRATHTITFIADKPGLHTCNGRDFAGKVQVADLDIDRALFPPANMFLNSPETISPLLRLRPHNSHKGSFGDVIVVGGAHGMCGAPILAARAASKCGAGRVFAAFIDTPPPYDSVQPELMCRYAPEMEFSGATIVAGPGLGTSQQAHAVLFKILDLPYPIVLDADALNLIAADDRFQQKLLHRGGGSLITPHPLEAARLLEKTAKEVQADRTTAAATLARRFNTVVILKGSGSIIAEPGGTLFINTTGNPALATAGTGDVLAGICGALIAQSFTIWNAALAATWLHGHAADTLSEESIGPIGMTASELIPRVRMLINKLTQQQASRH